MRSKVVKMSVLILLVVIMINPVNVMAAGSWRLNEQIRENNPVRVGADFNITANDTNRNTQEGLFQTEDNYGDSFFFRGTHHLNNNVVFAGHQWKIIRIEGNGSIRLIYNGLCPNNECSINDANSGMDTIIGYDRFSAEFGNEALMFEGSIIEGRLNNWLNQESNMSNEDRLLINRSNFCNDLEIASDRLHGYWGVPVAGDGIGLTPTLYQAIKRLFGDNTPGMGWSAFPYSPDVIPRVTCLDEFNISAYVGLITADEASKSGLALLEENQNSFLNNGLPQWTRTPGAHMGISELFSIINGELNATVANDFSTIRPVISLNADVVAFGDGSLENPFVVYGLYEEEIELPGDDENDIDDNNEVVYNPQTSGPSIVLYTISLLLSISLIIVVNKRKKTI